MFDSINEVAVIGCVLLMMAVNTVWYSSLLFGVNGDTAHLKKYSAPVQFGVTFASYVIMIAFLAYAEAVSARIGLAPLTLGVGIAAFLGAAGASLAIMEGKSLRYYLVHFGFFTVFIMGSIVVVQYWPW